MSDVLQELQKGELVQKALKDALEWLGEADNPTVKAMFSGGQGIIFRMESSRYPYPLSIKIPLFDGDCSPRRYRELIKRDWETQEIGAKEDHTIFPELICIADSGDYMIRQYVEGDALHYMASKASDEEKVAYFLQVTALTKKVFQAFHENKKGCYLIRDYRAWNILREEPSGRLYLIDCGSAKPEPKQPRETPENRNIVLGKTGYTTWAPEWQMDRRELIDRRIDFFSYGVMCFQMLYGYFPYSNDVEDEAAAWQKYDQEYRAAEEKIRADERLKKISQDLVEQLIGCLHPDPHKRFCGKLIDA